MARVRAVIRKIEPHDSVERYTGLGVEVLQGPRIVDPWTVEVALNEGGTPAQHPQHRHRHRRAPDWCRPARLEAVGYLTSDTLGDAPPNSTPRRAGCWCWAAGRSAASWRRPARGWDRRWCWWVARRAAAARGRRRRRLRPRRAGGRRRRGADLVVALRCELEQARMTARAVLVVADPASGSERRIAFDPCWHGRRSRAYRGLRPRGARHPDRRDGGDQRLPADALPQHPRRRRRRRPFQFTHVAAHQAWHAAVMRCSATCAASASTTAACPTPPSSTPRVTRGAERGRGRAASRSKSPATGWTNSTARSPTAPTAASSRC